MQNPTFQTDTYDVADRLILHQGRRKFLVVGYFTGWQ
jgi:hypothetical protein